MEVLNDILGYKKRKIYQDNECFSFSLDSVMLANFATIRLRDKKIVDLGCGNGVIPLILSLRTDKFIVGVEIQKKMADMAIKSIEFNSLSRQIEIINMDMKDFANTDFFETVDLITCNPPYFKVNNKNYFNESYEKMIARHEIEINLKDLLIVVNKLLKNNGNFAIVHRPERLMDVLSEFRKNKIEPKRLQLVYENIDKSAILVLVEGQKNGKSGLKIENPIIMYNNDGSMTDSYARLQSEVRK